VKAINLLYLNEPIRDRGCAAVEPTEPGDYHVRSRGGDSDFVKFERWDGKVEARRLLYGKSAVFEPTVNVAVSKTKLFKDAAG
jgi:hypothetical protein